MTAFDPQRVAAAMLLVGGLAAPGGAQAAPGASAPRSDDMGSTARPSRPTDRFPRERLVPLLKPSLGGWTRESLRSVRLPDDGPNTPPVEAEYTGAPGRATVTLTTVRPGPAWTGAPVERAIEGGSEKLYRLGQRPVREARYDSPARTVVTVSLANGIVLTASSPVADAAALRALLEAVDLDAAERLRPGAP